MNPSIDPLPVHTPAERTHAPPTVLPPLPLDRSPVTRSSSPRHHQSNPQLPSSSSRRSSRSGNPPAPTTSPSTPNRRRSQRDVCVHSFPHYESSSSRRVRSGRGNNLINHPIQWGEDTIANDESANNDDAANPVGIGGDGDNVHGHLLDDDFFLRSFVDADFSSPSSYPSFVSNPIAAEASQLETQAAHQPEQAVASNIGSAAPPRRSTACNRLFQSAPSRSTTQLTSSSAGESQNTVSSNEDAVEPLSQSANSSFSDKMPPPPRLQHIVNGFDAPSLNKRQSALGSNVAINNATVEQPLAFPSLPNEDLFGDALLPQRTAAPADGDMATVDLTEANEVPESLKRPEEPEVDNRTKISKFQCVICMDDASTLTVTHCGHLYCAQCLHSSLHVEATKGKCPMCRSKIDMKSRNAYNGKTKGFWPLELKLMTATRKGKRKAEDMS